MNFNICLTIVLLFLCVSDIYADIGFINGSNILLRKEAKQNSPYNKIFKKNELIYLIGKKNEWCIVKTQDEKLGWILEKQYMDSKKLGISKIFYDYIINDELITRKGISINTLVHNIEFVKYNDYIIFSYEMSLPMNKAASGGWMLFYKIMNNSVKLRLCITNLDKYYIDDDYVFITYDVGISVYSTSIFEKSKYSNLDDQVYKRISSLHVKDKVKRKYFFYKSHLKYNNKNRMVTLYLQDEKNGFFRIEKYKFNNGKFMVSR